jgi:hypothetical protein
MIELTEEPIPPVWMISSSIWRVYGNPSNYIK